MSGAIGASGGGAGRDEMPRPPESPPPGRHGSGVGDGAPRQESANDPSRGGTTMTSARPADSSHPQGQGYSSADQQHYHPPQAYPAPPGAAPTVGQQPSQAPPTPRARGGKQQPQGGVRRPRTGARTVPRVRKARLRVAKADPWSVMKVSFLLSIALGICTVIAVAVLWTVMDGMGVFSTIGETITQATETDDESGFDLVSFLSLSRVLIFTSVIAVIDVVLATALATLGAFLYNLSAGFVGGVEVTLAEDE
ncbi:DUF3566 domain-containing protein [Streptomyces sp. NBRC 109706]|uniref:DUF3566 domain-containing protein n=1 Tax=Streptomyces sp. NBRC 109706 TaxID=1550035 RepID=UPI00351C28E8